MKKQDFLFIILVVVVFLPFFLSDAVYDWYKSFNAAHGMVMSFLKFAILSSLGEVLGLRISAGVYNRKGFGIIPRMVVWGILGMGINAAMIIFSKGVPQFMEYMGMANAAHCNIMKPAVFSCFLMNIFKIPFLLLMNLDFFQIILLRIFNILRIQFSQNTNIFTDLFYFNSQQFFHIGTDVICFICSVIS